MRLMRIDSMNMALPDARSLRKMSSSKQSRNMLNEKQALAGTCQGLELAWDSHVLGCSGE